MAKEKAAPQQQPAVTENLESQQQDNQDAPLKATPELNKRNEALAAIAKRSEDPSVRAEIIGEDPNGTVPVVLREHEEDAPNEDAPIPNIAGDGTPAEGEQQLNADGEPVETPPAAVPENMVKLIVDGQEVLVPKDKVLERGVAALQKESAADSRLNAIESMVKELTTTVRSAQQPQPDPNVPAPKPLEQRIAELHQAIAYGTPEQGQAAMMEFLQISASAAEQTKGEVLTIVDQRSAAKEFASKYDDLLKDPMAMELVFSLERRVRAEERAQGLRPKPFGELYSAIGEQVRSYRNSLREAGGAAPNGGSGQPTPTAQSGAPSAQQSNRTAAKLNAPRAVSGSGGAPAKPAATKVPTASDVINQMAQLRGQRQGLQRQN